MKRLCAPILALLLGLALVAPIGCGGPARTGAPLTEPLLLSSMTDAIVLGQHTYMAQCHQCHPGGGAGLGPTITGTRLPDALVRFQVRNGLGVMPSFGKQQISDEELDGIIRYINALRRLQ